MHGYMAHVSGFLYDLQCDELQSLTVANGYQSIAYLVKRVSDFFLLTRQY